MAQIHLGIVEDDPLVRKNLIYFLGAQPEIEVLLTASNMEDFLDQLSDETPLNMILLDIGLPGMSGIQGIDLIRIKKPDIDIVMLTAYDDSEMIFEALCSGAVSYISKRTELPTIKEALIIVHKGGSYMSPSIARKVITHFTPKQKAPFSVLTPRQDDIVQGLVDGLSYKMIADKLDISVETVRDHIKKIYKKLQVNSKAEVIRKKLDGEI